jgi:hypothetical protein
MHDTSFDNLNIIIKLACAVPERAFIQKEIKSERADSKENNTSVLLDLIIIISAYYVCN